MSERRRGAALEEAILNAAWMELEANGYAKLTLENVAAHAGTSRPVLARRWPDRALLAIAAIRQQMERHTLDVEDVGDFRQELLELLEHASARARAIAVAFTLFASEYFGETGETPEELRAALITGEADILSEIIRRAAARGEVDASKLSAPTATLLSDLFRHHVIMTFKPPPPALCRSWVDDIFLPLVTPQSTGSRTINKMHE